MSLRRLRYPTDTGQPVSKKSRTSSDKPAPKQIQYLKQPNTYTCGPIALHNLILWTQFQVPKDLSYEKLEQLCQIKLPLGTSCRHFEAALAQIQRQLDLQIVYRKQPTYRQITSHLEGGGIMILLYHWDGRSPGSPINRETYGRGFCDHFVLVTEFQRDRFTIINHSFDHPVSHVVTRREFQTMIEPFEYKPALWPDAKDNIYPLAWFASR